MTEGCDLSQHAAITGRVELYLTGVTLPPQVPG
jgi:hypothetical protein